MKLKQLLNFLLFCSEDWSFLKLKVSRKWWRCFKTGLLCSRIFIFIGIPMNWFIFLTCDFFVYYFIRLSLYCHLCPRYVKLVLSYVTKAFLKRSFLNKLTKSSRRSGFNCKGEMCSSLSTRSCRRRERETGSPRHVRLIIRKYFWGFLLRY